MDGYKENFYVYQPHRTVGMTLQTRPYVTS